jgi:hypothetical protein
MAQHRTHTEVAVVRLESWDRWDLLEDIGKGLLEPWVVVAWEEDVEEHAAGECAVEGGTSVRSACHCTASSQLKKELLNTPKTKDHNVLMAEASATLACLNGLKSSLTLTRGVFLIALVPKKGLGPASFGLGELELLFGLGEDEGAPGVNAFALGLGLKVGALAFQLCCWAGVAPAGGLVPAAAAPLGAAGLVGVAVPFLGLKGGIAWMNIFALVGVALAVAPEDVVPPEGFAFGLAVPVGEGFTPAAAAA